VRIKLRKGHEMEEQVQTSQSRLERSSYFMTIALAVSLRSTCLKRKVGCVITDGNIILSTGYNGAPRGQQHCESVGCLLTDEGKCIRAVHAEINAIAQLNNSFYDTLSLWTTDQPCLRCLQALSALNASTIQIHYLTPYNCVDRDDYYKSLETQNSRRRIFMTIFKDTEEVSKGIKSIEDKLSKGSFTLFYSSGLKEDEMNCPLCDGGRRIFSPSCSVCHGTGVIKKKDYIFS